MNKRQISPRGLEDLLGLAQKTAKEAFRAIAGDLAMTRAIESEARRDIKVVADKKLEGLIIQRLRKASGFSIFSEESGAFSGASGCGDFRWIIDPLDGSFNFSRGIPMCCISIALWRGMHPFLGVVYDFNRDETFAGIDGKGAWLNGRPIRVSDVAKTSKAVVCTGFPISTDFSKEGLEHFVRTVKRFKKIRMLGSAALSLAYVSCGKADCYQEDDIRIWDVAAGIVLVKAAGGTIKMRPSGKENAFHVRAAGNRSLFTDGE